MDKLVDFLADYMIVQRTNRDDLRRLEAGKATSEPLALVVQEADYRVRLETTQTLKRVRQLRREYREGPDLFQEQLGLPSIEPPDDDAIQAHLAQIDR